jgi:hypothetical protein
MAYGLYLSLDQPKWFRNDFSDTDKLTGTIYTDINQTTAKNLTGYTIKVKLFKENRSGERFNKTATAVVAANGTWGYAVTDGDMPPPGLYLMKIELSTSTEQISTLNRTEFVILNGSAD